MQYSPARAIIVLFQLLAYEFSDGLPCSFITIRQPPFRIINIFVDVADVAVDIHFLFYARQYLFRDRSFNHING